MMERFNFVYAFSLAEAVMTLHGFHKDETICDIDVWIADGNCYLKSHGGYVTKAHADNNKSEGLSSFLLLALLEAQKATSAPSPT
nr:hypothetical protein [Tanacetum cinerariifolium]